jgi:hypothetical protein
MVGVSPLANSQRANVTMPPGHSSQAVEKVQLGLALIQD